MNSTYVYFSFASGLAAARAANGHTAATPANARNLRRLIDAPSTRTTPGIVSQRSRPWNRVAGTVRCDQFALAANQATSASGPDSVVRRCRFNVRFARRRTWLKARSTSFCAAASGALRPYLSSHDSAGGTAGAGLGACDNSLEPIHFAPEYCGRAVFLRGGRMGR
jgi:hypothetical protein